jgi:HAD superfamily hydrolase (TIGR01509 family)
LDQRVIRALIFDCDGTLVDNEPLHFRALNEALHNEGFVLTLAEYQQVMLPDDAAVRAALAMKGRQADDARVDALVAVKRAAYKRSLAAGLAPVPGVADFVRLGAKTYVMAVASGAWLDEVEAVLSQLGVRDCFRAVVSKEDCPVGKPDPAPFLRALERLNASSPAPEPPLTARDCLVFEDSVGGVAAARAAGMRSVALTTMLPGTALVDADLVAQNYRALDLRRMTAFFDRRAR